PRTQLGDVPALELSLEGSDHRSRGGRSRSSGRSGGRGRTQAHAPREPRRAEKQAPREPRREDRPRAPTPRQPEPEAPSFAHSRPVRPEDGLEAEAAAAPIALAAHREGTRPHRDGGRGESSRVVGFGDDLPAFLRRPVRVAGA
ncbi:MAG TPA: hypothetical protein VKU84_12560, partial [Stellaceae bacterium]|nr:hypothetical protein [Stellaceae bacterium]